MRIAAIIHARMASSRFPGKSMADLYGKPMVEWLVDKGYLSAYVDEVILATTTDPSDDVMAEYFKDKCTIYRGDVENYNLRIYNCLLEYEITHSMALTGDSPFLDPECMDLLCQLMHDNPDGYDVYGIPTQMSPTPIEGLWCGAQAISHYENVMNLFRTLPAAQQRESAEAPGKIAELRGYVPKLCEGRNTIGTDLWTTNMKLSIDYPAELMMANAVCRCLGHFPKDWREIHWAYANIKAEHFTDPA